LTLLQEEDEFSTQDEETCIEWIDSKSTLDLSKNPLDWTIIEGQLGIHQPKAILCQAKKMDSFNSKDCMIYCFMTFKHQPKSKIKVSPVWVPLFMVEANHPEILSSYYERV
jgi:hypothetical protein